MRAILIAAAMVAATAHGQMFAQRFGTVGTPISALAWYRLDGNALDSSGNGYDGTVYSVTYPSAVYGLGIAPDVASGAGFSSPLPDLTINRSAGWTTAAWIKRTGVFADYGDLSITRLPTGVANIKLGIEASLTTQQIKVSVRPDDRESLTGPFYAFPSNEWHHVALVMDATNAYLSVDGVVRSRTQFFANPVSTTDAVLMLGRYRGTIGSTITANGIRFDDVRIYDRALSPANIQRIMTGQDVAPIEELQ